MNTTSWYNLLIKPSWAPPDWLFGFVWSWLYIGIFITFGLVFYQGVTGKVSWSVVMPFVLNLIFNAAFSPLQFGLRNNLLASIDIVFIGVTLVWAIIAIWPHLRWISYANIPYLLWVSFATILQVSITWLNR